MRCAIAAMLLILAGCGQRTSCTSTKPQGLVAAMRTQDQFVAILGTLVRRTQTANMALVNSPITASSSITKWVQAAAKRHQSAWDQNLVQVWGMLTEKEIAQLCQAIAGGDQATYLRYAKRLGPIAQQKNTPVVQKAATEVVMQIIESNLLRQ